MIKQYDPTIFRAYDIRGVVPDQVDGDLAEQVARAFVAQVKPQRVVVGRDVRQTGIELKDRVIQGFVRSGVDVIDIGEVSTDVFYYACATRELPGIMVTASHNPAEYNGFKLVRHMPDLIMAKEFRPHVLDGHYPDADQQGHVEKLEVVDEFIGHLCKLIPPTRLRPLTVVVDTSNGAQGPVWLSLQKHLPITVIPLCFEPDSSFPNHGNDVIQRENQKMLCDGVKQHHADAGLIFDPDGDRCLLVDDRGETVPGDFITGLLAVSILKDNPGGTIVYDIRASDAVPELVQKAGGVPFVWKPGHVYIKAKMQELGAVFGGEVSGHYYFKDFWFADCGLLAGLTMLAYISGLPGKLSDEVAQLERTYHLSGEINSRVEDIGAVLDRVKARYADAEINELSGVAVRYPDWHCVVRPSDNEPLVRLTVEARSKGLMEQKRDEVLALIRSPKA